MIDSIRKSEASGETPGGGYSRSVSISRNDQAVSVMLLEPRLDELTAPLFLGAVNRVLEQCPEMQLVLDFSQVMDMDNHGMAAIILIFKHIMSNHRSLTICGVNARPQELFRITMLDQTLGAHYRPGFSLH